MNVMTWNPWKEMDLISDRVNRFFEDELSPFHITQIPNRVPFLKPAVDIYDHDEKIVHFNAMCQRLTGLQENDVIGTLPWEKVFKEEAPQWFKNLLADVNTGRFETQVKEHVCCTANGQAITVPWIYNLVVDDNREVKYLVATAKYCDNL